MSDETSLERAHALSAHASILLGPGQVTAQTLQAALKAYNDAAGLFEQASQGADGDASAKRTLQLLTTQHRKLARDLERKLQSAPIQDRGEGSSITRPPPPRQEAIQRGSVKRSQTTPVPVRDGPALGLGAIGREAWPPPGIATRVSPARGLPPFALRPTPSTRPEGLYPSNPATEQALSPLHSSSSSSGTEAGGSYINFGAIPDTLDPFSRFWGKLDNMLDDISNPVAFATASLDAGQAVGEDDVKEERRERRRTSERKKEREKGRESPGSFYLVNKHNVPKEPSNGSSSRTCSPTEKTPEELVLENENLRISLDAIASRAQEVDDENKRLKAEAGERSKMMKSAILEVKREYDELMVEAQKAKHGTDLMRSQLLGSIPSPNPRVGSRLEVGRYPSGVPVPNSDLVISQKKRIESLEEELRLMRVENEKNKEAAVKYKERIDKIKANAKMKKEAKSKGEGLSRE